MRFSSTFPFFHGEKGEKGEKTLKFRFKEVTVYLNYKKLENVYTRSLGIEKIQR